METQSLPEPDSAELQIEAEITSAFGPGLSHEPVRGEDSDNGDPDSDNQPTSMNPRDRDPAPYEQSFKVPLLDTSKYGRAACEGLNPDIFFPDKSGDDRKPKSICATCPPGVSEACALNAEDSYANGIWGGVSYNQRKISRSRRKQS